MFTLEQMIRLEQGRLLSVCYNYGRMAWLYVFGGASGKSKT